MFSALSIPTDQIWFSAKIGALLFLAIYVVFAIVIVRQVGLMTKTVRLGLEPLIKMLALLHLIFALGVVLIAVISL